MLKALVSQILSLPAKYSQEPITRPERSQENRSPGFSTLEYSDIDTQMMARAHSFRSRVLGKAVCPVSDFGTAWFCCSQPWVFDFLLIHILCLISQNVFLLATIKGPKRICISLAACQTLFVSLCLVCSYFSMMVIKM